MIGGAIRKGNWKLVKMAMLPGKTELLDLAVDPGEQHKVADENPDVVRDLESRLRAYATEQKPAEWIKAQPQFLGTQGETDNAMFRHGVEPFEVGRDSVSPVNAAYKSKGDFAFTGTTDKIEFGVTAAKTAAADLKRFCQIDAALREGR
jgi:hypothetical protein